MSTKPLRQTINKLCIHLKPLNSITIHNHFDVKLRLNQCEINSNSIELYLLLNSLNNFVPKVGNSNSLIIINMIMIMLS